MSDNNLLLPSDTPEQLHVAEWLNLLLDTIDGELNTMSRARLDEHLADCRICTVELARLAATDVALRGNLRRPQLAADFDARVLAMTGKADADARTNALRRAMEEKARAFQNLELGWRRSWHRFVAFLGIATLGMLALVIALDALLLNAWPDLVQTFPDAGLSPASSKPVLLTAGALGLALWMAIKATRGSRL